MEKAPKTFKQIEEAFKLGKQMTYARVSIKEIDSKKKRIKTESKSKVGFFKPWLPAVRIN